MKSKHKLNDEQVDALYEAARAWRQALEAIELPCTPPANKEAAINIYIDSVKDLKQVLTRCDPETIEKYFLRKLNEAGHTNLKATRYYKAFVVKRIKDSEDSTPQVTLPTSIPRHEWDQLVEAVDILFRQLDNKHQ